MHLGFRLYPDKDNREHVRIVWKPGAGTQSSLTLFASSERVEHAGTGANKHKQADAAFDDASEVLGAQRRRDTAPKMAHFDSLRKTQCSWSVLAVCSTCL